MSDQPSESVWKGRLELNSSYLDVFQGTELGIGIPEKRDRVQSLLDTLHIQHAASPHALVTSQAERG